MKRNHPIPLLALTLALALAACGGGESDSGDSGDSGAGASTPAPAARPTGPQPPPGGPLTMPEWYTRDDDTETIHLVITAGTAPENNYWNMNGFINGDAAITVPEGYNVMVHFANQDPNMAHSLGVQTVPENFAMPPTPDPVFEGAITQNPGSMIDGTMPGEEEVVEFVAAEAGEYTLVCYIPGHTAVGMWLYFFVSAEGEAGVQTR